MLVISQAAAALEWKNPVNPLILRFLFQTEDEITNFQFGNPERFRNSEIRIIKKRTGGQETEP